MAKAEIYPIAYADMREIGGTISRELRDPDTALQLIQRFRKTVI